jgi:hypothetical protein
VLHVLYSGCQGADQVLYGWRILLLCSWYTLFFIIFTSCRTALWNVGQSHASSNYICVYSKLMWHGRTQCVYRTSYEWSYVKTVVALCGVDWSLQNRSRRWWVWYNKAGALLSMWGLFANMCCLPNASFYPESFESRPSLGTTSMIRSPTGTWPDTTQERLGYFSVNTLKNIIFNVSYFHVYKSSYW